MPSTITSLTFLLPSNVYVKEEENIKHIVNSNKVKRKEDGDIVISSKYERYSRYLYR